MKMQPLRSSKIISALICITLLFSLSACTRDYTVENAITSYDEIKEYFEEKIKISEQDNKQTVPHYTIYAEYENNDEESNVNIWEYKLQQGNHQNPFAEAFAKKFL